jgi:hypothetical protein
MRDRTHDFLSYFGAMLALVLTGLLLTHATSASAQELLVNGSFESPVAPALGNNFYTTIPNWTALNVTPAQAQPFNIIRPHAGYASNPQATPIGGGTQYLDITSASATIRQSFTLSQSGVVSFGGWYSVRDFSQALTGLTISLRNSAGTVMATGSTSFAATDPIGLWKQIAVSNIALPAGTYHFDADIPNYANFDLATVVLQPYVTSTKVSQVYWDPVNLLTNPKLIPGALTTYTITVSSPGYALAANTVNLADVTPAGLALIVTDFGGVGSGPAEFTASGSGLAYSYAGLSSTTDRLDFSNNGGTTWTYVPVAGADGSDPAVTAIRLRPGNAMTANSSFTVRLRYRVK